MYNRIQTAHRINFPPDSGLKFIHRCIPTSMSTRKAQRYKVEEPVSAKWSNGGIHEVTGETRDVSSAGLFFYANFSPAEGSPVELVLTLPPEVTGSESKHVLCRGRVVRVEDVEDHKYGVAVEIDGYEVISSDN